MTIDRNTVLFFDASCIVAAVGSPSGGSSFLLSVCAKGLLRGAVSQPVLLEAERNIVAKLGANAYDSYRRLMVVTPLLLVSLPAKTEPRRYREIVGEKDEHVVAVTEHMIISDT